MPEMDGYAVAEAIRREETGGRRMPILALTANALRGEASRAKAVGMDEYLTKPVKLILLKAALERWLSPAGPEPTPAGSQPEATGERQAAPVVNVKVLEEFIGDDPETVREFLSDYLSSARKSAAELHVACASNAARLVGDIAHTLKSSSRSVGALSLGDICAGLENDSKAGSMAAIRQGMAQFDRTLMEVETCIEEILLRK